MDLVKIYDLRIYAYHGVHELESIVGQWYIVNLELRGDFTAAKSTDNLQGTIDYVVVVEVVKDEMAIPSKLIEHVAQRIASKLKSSFSLLKNGKIEIIKEQPPVKGVGSVGVVVEV